MKSAGGTVRHAPTDIPDVGRFAAVADPHGAMFNLFEPDPTDAASMPANDSAGHVGWRELHSGDMPSAFDFYAQLFGWKKTDTVNMGPLGVYQLFSTGGAFSLGGMMTKQGEGPPRWLYYFNVEEIDAAVERTKSSQGRIVSGPVQVPGGSWIAQGVDPQGAMFAMVSQQRAGA